MENKALTKEQIDKFIENGNFEALKNGGEFEVFHSEFSSKKGKILVVAKLNFYELTKAQAPFMDSMYSAKEGENVQLKHLQIIEAGNRIFSMNLIKGQKEILQTSPSFRAKVCAELGLWVLNLIDDDDDTAKKK